MTTLGTSTDTSALRTPCQVYTRVMGYLRPVSQYNIGKKSEFYSRKYFEEQQSTNSQFMRNFAECEPATETA